MFDNNTIINTEHYENFSTDFRIPCAVRFNDGIGWTKIRSRYRILGRDVHMVVNTRRRLGCRCSDLDRYGLYTVAAVNRTVTAPAGGLALLTKVLNRYYRITKGALLTALKTDSLVLSYTHADAAAQGAREDSLHAFVYTGTAWSPIAIVRQDTALNILVTASVTALGDIIITGADKTVAGPPIATIGEARKDLNNDLIADHSVTKDTLKVYGVITNSAIITRTRSTRQRRSALRCRSNRWRNSRSMTCLAAKCARSSTAW